MENLRTTVCEIIEQYSDELNSVSQELWQNPELCFEEHKAHKLLTDYLEKKGFAVERGYKGLSTAFCAEFGSSDDGPHVCVICEYDALPGIGHACGHNLIAEAGVAAGLGIQAAMKQSKKPLGKITVLGSPAEEGGGGKIPLIAEGAFESVDVAMMSHPAFFSFPMMHIICVQHWKIKYRGRSVHASACPWDGLNALDAAVLAYQNVSCMRQAMKPDCRVHGVIVNGGEKPNIIPALTELCYYLRAPDAHQLQELSVKMRRCFEGAAAATGCDVEIEEVDFPYMNLISNGPLEESFRGHAEKLEVKFDPPEVAAALKGSTDMGNVSFVVPSIHPAFAIGGGPEAVNHSIDFTAATGDARAQPYTLQQGKAMALTALDVYTDSDFLARVKQQFKLDLENQGADKLRKMIGYKD